MQDDATPPCFISCQNGGSGNEMDKIYVAIDTIQDAISRGSIGSMKQGIFRLRCGGFDLAEIGNCFVDGRWCLKRFFFRKLVKDGTDVLICTLGFGVFD